MQAVKNKSGVTPKQDFKYATGGEYPPCELIAARRGNTVIFAARELDSDLKASLHQKFNKPKLSLKLEFTEHPGREITAIYTFRFKRRHEDTGTERTFISADHEADILFNSLSAGGPYALRDTFNRAAQWLIEHLALEMRHTSFMVGQETVPALIEAIYLNRNLKLACLKSPKTAETNPLALRK